MGNIRGWAGGTMSPEGMLNWINERKNLYSNSQTYAQLWYGSSIDWFWGSHSCSPSQKTKH